MVTRDRTVQEYLEIKIKSADLEPLYEAAGPDAWDNPRETIREIATAIKNGDGQALLEAMEEQFFDYLEGYREHDRAFTEEIDDFYDYEDRD